MSAKLVTGRTFAESSLANERANSPKGGIFSDRDVPLRRGASWGYQLLVAMLLALAVITVFRESSLFLRHPVSSMNADPVEPACPRIVVMFGQDTRVQENTDRPSDRSGRAAREWNGPTVALSPQPPPQRRSQN